MDRFKENPDGNVTVNWLESSGYDNFEISFGDSYLRGILNKEYHVLYINEVLVPLNIRELGIGTRLLERLKQEAMARNIKMVTAEARSLGGLKVFRKVFPSMKVYKKGGSFLQPKNPSDELNPDEIIAQGSDDIVVDLIAEI